MLDLDVIRENWKKYAQEIEGNYKQGIGVIKGTTAATIEKNFKGAQINYKIYVEALQRTSFVKVKLIPTKQFKFLIVKKGNVLNSIFSIFKAIMIGGKEVNLNHKINDVYKIKASSQDIFEKVFDDTSLRSICEGSIATFSYNKGTISIMSTSDLCKGDELLSIDKILCRLIEEL
ncbi:hypothetical protein [Clostridium lundense]|uniref:hypothetical protein n=1 Tax=Clostridium lundense TaxID=319475 RepID=UPI000484E413|nr:hypothetical protein [Clostridium lundense]